MASPPKRLTTRCHGSPRPPSYAIQPTSRAARGRPAMSASSPYVTTRPRGTRRSTAYTRRRKSDGCRCADGRPFPRRKLVRRPTTERRRRAPIERVHQPGHEADVGDFPSDDLDEVTVEVFGHPAAPAASAEPCHTREPDRPRSDGRNFDRLLEVDAADVFDRAFGETARRCGRGTGMCEKRRGDERGGRRDACSGRRP